MVKEKANYRNADERMAFTSAIFIYATLIVDLFRKINALWLGLPSSSTTVVRNAIYVLLFVYIVWDAASRGKITGLFLLSLSFVIVLSVSYLLDYRIAPLMADALFMFFARLLPAYYITRHTTNWDLLFSEIEKLRWIALAYAIIVLVYPESASNYMPLAYNLLIPTIVTFFEGGHQGKRSNYVLAALFFSVMLVYGARGPILCFISSVLIYAMMSFQHQRPKRKVVIVFMGTLLLIALFLSFDLVIEWLFGVFPNSRTLGLVNSRLFFAMSNRDSYYRYGLASVAEAPLRIRGLFGDRLVFASAFASQDMSGTYAHNFLVEILMQFGVIIGASLCIFWLLRLAFCTIRVFSMADRRRQQAFAAFAGAPLVYSMISGSYLLSYEIWLMFGLLANFTASKNSVESRSVVNEV